VNVLAIERRLECAKLVKKHSNAPHITLVVIGVVLDNLWAQIVGGTDHGSCHLVRRLHDASDAEIAQFDDVALSEEDVQCLDITMHDLAVVAVLQSEANLSEPMQDLFL